jgi:diguanylate cyclase
LTQYEPGAGEGRYRALFEQARDAMFITDLDGVILETNDAAVDLTGQSRHRLRGQTLHALFGDPEDGRLLREVLQSRSGAQAVEIRLRRPDGESRWCMLSLAPGVDASGGTVGFHGIAYDITARKEAEERLLHDALHDPLTGLPNRLLFSDRLGLALARWRRHPGRRCAVLFLDLDNFKAVNDTLGHAAGDALLTGVADALLACIRGEDTVARLGGDEFAILLDTVDTDSDAVRAAERVQERLQQPIEYDGTFLLMSASIGISFPDHSEQTAADLLRNSDTAMYRAKAAGPARYAVFSRSMTDEPAVGPDLEADLRHALPRSEFVLQYQPILNLQGGQVAGMEALIRWHHPRLGVLLPHQFLDLADRVGLTVGLGDWVLRQACAQARLLMETIPRGGRPFIAVNLSARQLLLPELPDQISDLLHEERVPGRMLSLEIGERTLAENASAASATLRRLRALGVRVCVHDFGTGQLVIPNLTAFPVDSLKIDRSFVSRISAGGDTGVLVQSIVQLAARLRISAGAQGIETGDQLERLRRLRPLYVQGYLFSRPMDAGAAGAMVANAFAPLSRRPQPARGAGSRHPAEPLA